MVGMKRLPLLGLVAVLGCGGGEGSGGTSPPADAAVPDTGAALDQQVAPTVDSAALAPDVATAPIPDAMPAPADVAPMVSVDVSPAPTCRPSGEACGVTADCCAGLFCQANRCATPPPPVDAAPAAPPDTAPLPQPDAAPVPADMAPAPMCRQAKQACAATADCCQGLVCEQMLSRCEPPPSGSMRWDFEHACPGAGEIRFRVFDAEWGWVYPNKDEVYVIVPGPPMGRTLACVPGAQLCYGARSGTLYWGKDVDGSKACGAQGCCWTCGQGNPPIVRFVCN